MSHPQSARIPSIVNSVCRALADAGGRAWLVGGSVRDMLLGHSPKDPDIEVYGMSLESLRNTLESLGKIEWVGRQFGVFKLWKAGHCIDVALPRTECKTAAGHKGFEVTPNPDLEPETASLRRDFTINAMMFDPLTGRLLDFHGGRRDLKTGVLRHVSNAFAEDPLRVLRGMQFAARFKLSMHAETIALCRGLLAEADSLPVERIWMEWLKWAESRYPSRGLVVLQQTEWISLYPELTALVGCPQEPAWHPEGDVWVHTLQTTDQAAAVALRHGWQGEKRRLLVLAALCHDFGKPETTRPDTNGHIRSPEHSIIGMELSRRFLSRIGAPRGLAAYVEPLVKEHLTHMHGQPTPKAVRRLSHRLEPADIELWEALVEADASGRSPHPPFRPATAWLETARRLAADKGKPKAIVNGRMLMQLGIKPGPQMGEILRQAYEAQMDGLITDEASALAWCQAYVGRSQSDS